MSTPEQDDVKRRERAQQVALFRYQLICPALDPGLSTKARGRIVRAIAAGSHAGPFGGQHRYSRDSLDRWIRRYRAGGFDALMPSIRQPGSRIDTGVLELAVALKRENAQRTAAQVARILRASTGYSPSESTLLRLFHRRELIGPAAGEAVVFGRFEASAPNERWVGDALHGPRVGGRKTYLFAFLDDQARLAVGYRFGFAEDTVRLAAALEPALACRGVPASCYVDNGSAYVDAWLLRACGKLGIRLIHSTPHRPQGRGKIERFLCATRRSFASPVQPGGIGGRSLGLLAYLDPKGEGDRSLPGNQRPGPDVWDGALGDPRDMAKAGLPESQSPEGESSHPPERHLKPAPGPAASWNYADATSGPGAMPSEGIEGDEWGAYITLHRVNETNVGSPTGREPYGDAGLVVVAGVTPGRGGRESRPQGEGGQVIRTPGRPGGMRNAERRNGAGCPT